MNSRKRRQGVWLAWIGGGLASISFASCMGIARRGTGMETVDRVFFLAGLTLIGFVLMMTGLIVILLARKD
jgi:hypothetical protein